MMSILYDVVLTDMDTDSGPPILKQEDEPPVLERGDGSKAALSAWAYGERFNTS